MTSEQRTNNEEWVRSKIGQRIATRVEFSGVPRWTSGTVISSGGLGTVAIQWDMAGQKPLIDWFTREEYERFMGEKI